MLGLPVQVGLLQQEDPVGWLISDAKRQTPPVMVAGPEELSGH